MPRRGDRPGVSVLQSVSPVTSEIISTYDETSPADAERLVARADRAFESWSRTSFGVRAASLRKAADLLEERTERYAALMALEMGKPLAQGRAEIEKCASACRFFADHAGEFLAPEPVATGGSKSYVTYRPLGVVLGVMPWNFPFWQVFRFAAPAVMAGNACVLKHASNVSGCRRRPRRRARQRTRSGTAPARARSRSERRRSPRRCASSSPRG